jgi:hypothetical protein
MFCRVLWARIVDKDARGVIYKCRNFWDAVGLHMNIFAC